MADWNALKFTTWRMQKLFSANDQNFNLDGKLYLSTKHVEEWKVIFNFFSRRLFSFYDDVIFRKQKTELISRFRNWKRKKLDLTKSLCVE